MKIAVLSGKGGTGKTLVSVNMAAATRAATYVDCDVEEPNGHLFFKPRDVQVETVAIKIPWVDQQLCDGCQQCVQFCNFNALAHAGGKLVIFEDICHACGGCILLCPQHALTETEKPIGQVRRGKSRGIAVHSGELNPGIPSGVPIITQLLQGLKDDGKPVFIDCPPGSACIVMESIAEADYCLLVAEPTVFGAHNLELVHQLVTLFEKPHGVVLNKCIDGPNPSQQYCQTHQVPVLASIPYDEKLGRLTSNGLIAVWEDAGYRQIFLDLLERVSREVAG